MRANNRKLLYIILAAIVAAAIMYFITKDPQENPVLEQPNGEAPHKQEQDN
ncbi:hypothetical protein [Olivibacter sitiensis]|uniref:hypothetical protein n=1 Tax=Olivibacter sitiensis TaxID=376470 RepID=UPI00042126EB|nr:hypothetical protein [Olivibacter sitiensis]